MGAGQRHDRVDAVRIGPAADDLMRAGLRHVQHGHAIRRDSGLDQVFRHQAANIAGGPQRGEAAAAIGFAIGPGRRIGPPGIVGRAKALHPAPLLINEDGRIAAANGGAERVRQRLELGRTFTIAFEDNEAERVGPGKERLLRRAERQRGASAS